MESKLADDDPRAVDPLISMAKGHALLGRILATQPDGTEWAIAEYQQAVERLEKVNREHPEFSDQTCELRRCLGDLSNLSRPQAGLTRRSPVPVRPWRTLNASSVSIPRFSAISTFSPAPITR